MLTIAELDCVRPIHLCVHGYKSSWPYTRESAWMTSFEGLLNLTKASNPVPSLFLRCCALPIHRIRPRCMTANRVASASASSMLCVVSSTDDPFSLMLLMMFHICRLASGSIPADGSSRNTTSALPHMETAVISLRLFPPD